MHTHPCRKKEWERREVGGSFLLQLIFLKYFIWILAAVVLQKTKGNEPCVSEPKTTYSVRKSWCSCCSQHSEKQSQSKLLKTARGYVKHKGRKMSWWNDIWVVAGDRLASHTAKQVKYKTQVVLILHDSKLVFWGGGFRGCEVLHTNNKAELLRLQCLSNLCFSLTISGFFWFSHFRTEE